MEIKGYSGARAYVLTWINRPKIDNNELVNDAANIHSDSYDNYMEIYEKLCDEFSRYLK